MNTINQIQQYNTNFARSQKVPRYIYHLTSKANYDSILQDGFIKPTQNKFFVKNGVYALELANFFKRWKINKDWGYDDLQYLLLRHIVKWMQFVQQDTNELVILKIPTSELDLSKLKIRCLNKLFKHEDEFETLAPGLQSHLRGETPVSKAPLYKRRKNAIEYIYDGSIPVEKAKRIGNIVNVASLRKSPAFSLHPVKFIMQALLSGTPESKGAELLE